MALRKFLSGFRIPGEAQKIDRILEKFAEKFQQSNPDVFPSADTAFVLAFSIIMLNTDAHNPSIREERKMTKQGFLRQNQGIASGRDLSDEYIGGIYDRIRSNAISLREDDDERRRREGEEEGDGGRTRGGSHPASNSQKRRRRQRPR